MLCQVHKQREKDNTEKLLQFIAHDVEGPVACCYRFVVESGLPSYRASSQDSYPCSLGHFPERGNALGIDLYNPHLNTVSR